MNRCLLYIALLLISVQKISIAQNSGGKLYLLENDDVNKPKILTLYQDKQGLILCGTTKGLYRFDGFDFTPYPQEALTSTEVTAIFQTSDNKLWIGYGNGSIGLLSRGEITPIKFEEGLPKVPIRSITQDDAGAVWIATAGEGIYYFKDNRVYNMNEDDGLSDNYVYKIIFIPGHGVIAATDRGINICSVRGNKKNITAFTSKNGLPDNIVRTLYAAENKYLWLGMQDAGIKAYTYDLETAPAQHNWNYGQVNDIVVANSRVFVATEDSALVVYGYDRNGIVYNNAYVDRTIPKLNCLLRDREGNIWAAGGNQLLRTGKAGMEQLYRLSKQEAEQVHSLHYTSDSALWFNIAGELMRLFKKNGQWQSEKFKLAGFSNTTITSLYEAPGDNLWVGSLGKGITVFNHAKKTQSVLQDPFLRNSNIISISGKGNIVWITALEGVVQATISDDHISYVNYTDTAGIGNKYVYHIFPDSKNRVWFATDGDGVSVLDQGKFIHLENQRNYLGNVVYNILEDHAGNIWYATYDKGIVKYDGKKFINYTVEQGLSDAGISGFLNAGQNLAVIHKNSIDIINPLTGRISYLNKAQGEIDINTDLNACTNDNAGNIYFVSNGIIYSYNLPAEETQQPAVIIDKINLFLNDVDAENGHVFKHNQNNLSFYFTGIYYSQPERISYQYKLENYDKQWTSTKDRVKVFPDLPPGKYTFRVKASLNKNFTNASETSFSFVISKPFWLQAWFIIISSALLAALLYGFIKTREKSINRLNTLQNEKIQSQLETLRNQVNPHFLFNSFNILISEIENNPDIAVTYVEKLSDFYRKIITHRDKDLIPLEDELNILLDYKFLQQKRFASGLAIEVCVTEETINSSYIPPLVLQMLTENAIKHNIVSPTTPLCIRIKETSDGCLAVTNNINKKLQPEKSSGLGLQNIQRRYALLHISKVQIESNDQYFTVKIPLVKK
ncbi:MAG TPA: two-component regulator propeller domain-containing protein [Parafilimonas sp.]|nr:two-component regulator propeller domain-containing protein [Parafilimonas sp.]